MRPQPPQPIRPLRQAGQGASFPTFFVRHRPDLSEFVVCGLEEWAGGSRRALGRQAFAELIRGLPGWG
jgi:hypothetical protein